MKTPMRNWEIKVSTKSKTLAEFEVPAHKLGSKDIRALLKAIVASGRAGNPETMTLMYVNRRRGEPARLNFAECRQHADLRRGQTGIFCGDWEFYATAMQDADPTVIRWLKRIRRRRDH
jgi:hypothetical protein